MKLLFTSLFLFLALATSAQQFGIPITEEQALDAATIDAVIADQVPASLKVKGTVLEVCQVKGCWMTMNLGDSRSMRITFKDYSFFVPTNCSGKTAVLQGQLTKETISITTLKHYAKDAGKSEQEIAAISEPQTELIFVADGVLLLP